MKLRVHFALAVHLHRMQWHPMLVLWEMLAAAVTLPQNAPRRLFSCRQTCAEVRGKASFAKTLLLTAMHLKVGHTTTHNLWPP